jgi:hypothetical protein
MTYPFGQTVTVLDGSVTGQDSDGNDVRTFPTKATYVNVVVAPAGTNELLNAQETVSWDLDLYPPPGADIQPVDRVVVDSVTYEVFGRKQEWQSPFSGWAPGGYVRLTEVTG